jgi:hypothetical protein
MKGYKFFVLFLLLSSLLSAIGNEGGKEDKMRESSGKKQGPMERFEFLLGGWNLEYRVPKSSSGEADTGNGTGTNRFASCVLRTA